MKRLLDITVALAGLLLASPVLLPVMFLVWWQDRHSPFYIAPRVGLDGRTFRMVKLRSMRINADKSGVDSTSAADSRITPVGHFIRRYKLDEITQLWNVLCGDMSLVGPRPNVERETRLYTAAEKLLLSVRPGITDYASIVFADEGEILAGHPDPDLGYNQLIRPWKSRLGLFYIDHSAILLDLKLVGLTALAILSRKRALGAVAADLQARGAPAELVEIAGRRSRLVPHPPPGATEVVQSRDAVAA
ncbi:MAG: sugar transferase [Gammaproteobacteria bacterium]|nr:sugar transferase [Gammaproteobacteria bacterium]QOJ32635.1 MAG: sugar transferase [Gammaproteobacteria bacterium]